MLVFLQHLHQGHLNPLFPCVHYGDVIFHPLLLLFCDIDVWCKQVLFVEIFTNSPSYIYTYVRTVVYIISIMIIMTLYCIHKICPFKSPIILSSSLLSLRSGSMLSIIIHPIGYYEAYIYRYLNHSHPLHIQAAFHYS